MKNILKLLLLGGVIGFATFSCNKKEVLPANQAKGKIIARLGQCYGAWVIIEVENPKRIGTLGTLGFIGNAESRITYKNAIGVPYFDRIPDLNTDAPMAKDTWLHFEYRKLTDQERNSNIFVDTSFYGICNMMIGPPSVNRFIVTEIIGYREK